MSKTMGEPPSEPLANWNGTEMPLDQVRVSVLDRAFLFGDAIYEVIRVHEGKPFLFDEHIERLKRNLDKLALRIDVDLLAQRLLETLSHSGCVNGLVYIQVTRGEAPRSHHFPDPPATPNELIYVKDIANDPYAEARVHGAKVITLPDLRWKRCDIKSVNLLANCMAAEAAHQAGCDEAILVTDEGILLEGTHTSLFGVRQGRILTAPLAENVLPGITRGLVMRLAQQAGIEMIEETLRSDSLPELDELFLTGTTANILPVTIVDGISVGNGTIGPVTHRLIETFEAFIQA